MTLRLLKRMDIISAYVISLCLMGSIEKNKEEMHLVVVVEVVAVPLSESGRSASPLFLYIELSYLFFNFT